MCFLFEGSAFYATLQCYNIFKNYSNYVLRERWHDVDGGRLAVSGRRGGGWQAWRWWWEAAGGEKE